MKYLKELFIFLNHIIENFRLIKTLIKNDFNKQYLGSYLGLFWAFAQPVIFISVIWFVFEIGFKGGANRHDVPFFLWLICGMVPWLFFSGALSAGVNSIVSNAFLVKKVAFRVSILPIVQIGSALIIHLVLLAALILVFLLYGYSPSLYWLQLFYYLFCTLFLLLGINLITSSIRVFVKDTGNLISVVIQIGFWATPIFWSMDMVPEQYQSIIKAINPMVYVVDGYRDTFVNKVWFWEKGFDTVLFLGVSSIFLIIGAVVFRRLRPHFGDVL